MGRIFAGLALAELHLEHGDNEQAAQMLEEVARASDASHRPTLQSLVTLHRAKLARVLGDEAAPLRCWPRPDSCIPTLTGRSARCWARRP